MGGFHLAGGERKRATRRESFPIQPGTKARVQLYHGEGNRAQGQDGAARHTEIIERRHNAKAAQPGRQISRRIMPEGDRIGRHFHHHTARVRIGIIKRAAHQGGAIAAQECFGGDIDRDIGGRARPTRPDPAGLSENPGIQRRCHARLGRGIDRFHGQYGAKIGVDPAQQRLIAHGFQAIGAADGL